MVHNSLNAGASARNRQPLNGLGLMFVLLFAAVLPPLLPPAYAEEETSADEPPADTAEIPQAEEQETEEQDAPPENLEKKWYRGSIRAGFDGLWSRRDRDIEMDQFFQFNIDPPKQERLHLHGALWMIEKIDPPSSERSGLRDLNDTFSEQVITRLSSLHLDMDDLWGDSVLRLGRQRINEGAAYNRIDGIYFKQKQAFGDWYVFGGTRATFYGDNFDDPTYGAGVSITPSGRTKLALDAYAGREQQYAGRRLALHGPVAALYYHLTGKDRARTADTMAITFSLWQTVNEYLSLFGRLNWYDAGGEEILLNASGYVPGGLDITYEITYRRQFNSIGDRTSDLTGFYRTVGVYEGYDNLFMAAYRPITEKIMVSLEMERHWTHSGNWSNRNYQRYAAYLQGEKLFGAPAVDAKIGLERWDVSKGGGSWAVVGEVGRRWERSQVVLGADYQRYKDRVTEYNEPLMWLDMTRAWLAPGILQGYNPLVLIFNNYTVEMQENIYTVYIRGRWNITENQDLSAKIAYEEGDGPDTPYWRVQADYTYRF